MPQTMLTVRGNLGANPDYLPEKTMEDGVILPAKLQAVWIGYNVLDSPMRDE